MPWKESHTSDEHIKFIAQLLSGDTTMTDPCRRLGVSRKIRARLERLHPAECWPAASSIDRVIEAAGLVRLKQRRRNGALH